MGKCCANTPGDLVVAEKGDKTCKVNFNVLKIFNTFILNRQQNIKTNNTLDFESTKLTKAFGRDAVRS